MRRQAGMEFHGMATVVHTACIFCTPYRTPNNFYNTSADNCVTYFNKDISIFKCI